MCGRYVTPDEAAIEREFSRVIGPFARDPERRRRYNAAPTQRLPVVRPADDHGEILDMRWGLIPFFARGRAGGYSTINARAETVATSPAFRTAWKRGQRCLVPAEGFYEWHVNPDGRKQPFYVRLADQTVFAFAGLWDRSVPADGEPIESFAILTVAANPLMAEIHNSKARMPVILRAEDWEPWLRAPPPQAQALLAQYPQDLMDAYPVSARVGNPKNDDARLIEKITVQEKPAEPSV